MVQYSNRNSQTDVLVTLYPARNFPTIISPVVCNTILLKFLLRLLPWWGALDHKSLCLPWLFLPDFSHLGIISRRWDCYQEKQGTLSVQPQLELLLNLVQLQLYSWLPSLLLFQGSNHSAIFSLYFPFSTWYHWTTHFHLILLNPVSSKLPWSLSLLQVNRINSAHQPLCGKEKWPGWQSRKTMNSLLPQAQENYNYTWSNWWYQW